MHDNRIEKYVNAIGLISDGSRNNTLHGIGILLRTRFGLTGDALASALSNVNQTKCILPLEDTEVSQIAQSVDKSNAPLGGGGTVRHKTRQNEYTIVIGDTISIASILERRISVYSKCWMNTPSRETTIGVALETFKTGGKSRDQVEAVRAEPDKEKRNKLKQNTLPGVVFASEPQSIRNIAACIANQVIGVDCDGIAEDELEALKEAIAALPYVFAVVISASGRGLFVLIAYQGTPNLKQLLAALQKDFPCEIDAACSDISRLRFTTLDPNLIIKDEVSPAILTECQDKIAASVSRNAKNTGENWTSTYTDAELSKGNEKIRCAPFPLDALPSDTRDVVKTIAKAQSIPVSFVAYAALPHSAAAIGNSVEVRCYADGGAEPPILWMGSIIPSGVGKTEVLRKLRLPFETIDREYATKFQEESTQYQQDMKAGLGGTAPVEKHLLIQDATMEAIFVLCSKNPHGLLLSEPEGKQFFSFDRYRIGKTDEANYCKLYDREFFKINRTGAPPISGVGMLSLAIMIQPCNFRKAIEVNPGMLTSGLLARMNLCYPVIGEFCIPKQVDRSPYHNWFQAIDDVIKRRTDGTPVAVVLDDRAQAIWDDYMTHCRNLARKTQGWLGGYYDRLHVTAIRLALQFHYFEGGGPVMGASVVERGITVAEYMKSQNELVAEVFAGERVAGKLTADQQAVLKVLQNSDTPLTANEIRFANRQTQKIDVEKTVSELSKAGLIQGEFRQFGDKGRPAKRYRISDTCTVSVSRNAKNPDENWTSTYTDTIAEDKSAVSGTEVIEGFEEYRNLEASSKSVEQPNGSSVGMTEDVSGVDGNTANTEADDYSGGWAVRDGYETTTLDGEYSPDFDDSQWESDRRDASHRR